MAPARAAEAPRASDVTFNAESPATPMPVRRMNSRRLVLLMVLEIQRIVLLSGGQPQGESARAGRPGAQFGFRAGQAKGWCSSSVSFQWTRLHQRTRSAYAKK